MFIQYFILGFMGLIKIFFVTCQEDVGLGCSPPFIKSIVNRPLDLCDFTSKFVNGGGHTTESSHHFLLQSFSGLPWLIWGCSDPEIILLCPRFSVNSHKIDFSSLLRSSWGRDSLVICSHTHQLILHILGLMERGLVLLISYCWTPIL